MFFYVVFPYILPIAQRMSADRRNVWIVRHYWLQLFSYFIMSALYMTVIPMMELRADQLLETPDIAFNVNAAMGYWVARSWPVRPPSNALLPSQPPPQPPPLSQT